MTNDRVNIDPEKIDPAWGRLSKEFRMQPNGRVTAEYLHDDIKYWTEWVGVDKYPDLNTHGKCSRSMSQELLDSRAKLIAARNALLAAEKDLATFEREMSGIAPEAKSPALPLIREALTALRQVSDGN